jgi:hypothetical protein
MSPRRRIIFHCAALCVVACADESSTAPLVGVEAPLDFDLAVPRLSRELMVARDSRVVGPPDGPARVLAEDEADYVGQEEPWVAPGIWNAQSGVVFWGSTVQGWGSHEYVANRSRVEVTATVWHDGVEIGRRTGGAEETHLFFPWVRYLVGGVSIATDTECGLSADASSDHFVSWEFAPGTSAASFGSERTSSASGIEHQPVCEPEPATSGGGGGTSGIPEELSSDYTCWMWFTYDEATLEVLDIQATWCTGGG